MLNIPEIIKERLDDPSYRRDFRVKFPNGEHRDLTKKDITDGSLKINESICSSNRLKFGLSEVPSISFEATDIPNLKNSEIECFYEIECNEELYYDFDERKELTFDKDKTVDNSNSLYAIDLFKPLYHDIVQFKYYSDIVSSDTHKLKIIDINRTPTIQIIYAFHKYSVGGYEETYIGPNANIDIFKESTYLDNLYFKVNNKEYKVRDYFQLDEEYEPEPGKYPKKTELAYYNYVGNDADYIYGVIVNKIMCYTLNITEEVSELFPLNEEFDFSVYAKAFHPYIYVDSNNYIFKEYYKELNPIIDIEIKNLVSFIPVYKEDIGYSAYDIPMGEYNISSCKKQADMGKRQVEAYGYKYTDIATIPSPVLYFTAFNNWSDKKTEKPKIYSDTLINYLTYDDSKYGDGSSDGGNPTIGYSGTVKDAKGKNTYNYSVAGLALSIYSGCDAYPLDYEETTAKQIGKMTKIKFVGDFDGYRNECYKFQKEITDYLKTLDVKINESVFKMDTYSAATVQIPTVTNQDICHFLNLYSLTFPTINYAFDTCYRNYVITDKPTIFGSRYLSKVTGDVTSKGVVDFTVLSEAINYNIFTIADEILYKCSSSTSGGTRSLTGKVFGAYSTAVFPQVITITVNDKTFFRDFSKYFTSLDSYTIESHSEDSLLSINYERPNSQKVTRRTVNLDQSGKVTSTSTASRAEYFANYDEIYNASANEIISAGLELEGMFGISDRNGTFIKKGLSNSKIFDISESERSDFWYDDYYSPKIGKVTVSYMKSDTEIASYTHNIVESDLYGNYSTYSLTGNYIIENNIFTEASIKELVSKFANAVKDIAYMPCSLTVVNKPYLEVGDFIKMKDGEEEIVTFIEQLSVSGFGYIYSEIASEYDRDDNDITSSGGMYGGNGETPGGSTYSYSPSDGSLVIS